MTVSWSDITKQSKISMEESNSNQPLSAVSASFPQLENPDRGVRFGPKLKKSIPVASTRYLVQLTFPLFLFLFYFYTTNYNIFLETHYLQTLHASFGVLYQTRGSTYYLLILPNGKDLNLLAHVLLSSTNTTTFVVLSLAN